MNKPVVRLDGYYKRINPVGFHYLSLMLDGNIRYVLSQGGSSSGKSFSFAQICLLATLLDGENTLVIRKVGASIEKTIFEDFCQEMEVWNSKGDYFKKKQNKITCHNGAHIDFTGLDDPEKIKGISNYKRLFMDELTEYDYADWQQIRTRMRGKRGQQLFGAYNPIDEMHWIKTKIVDTIEWNDISKKPLYIFDQKIPEELSKLKSVHINSPTKLINPQTGEIETIPPNFVYLKSTYLNNFWVVGSPDGTYGYYDRQCILNYENDKATDPDYYRIYALGEWGVIRTGGEFLPSFSYSHVQKVPYRKDLPIHVSVDNNVLPYITTTLWQYDIEAKRIMQIGEVCAADPDNTVSRAASLVCAFLRRTGYAGSTVYLHGDVTTKAASTIDDEKRSFFDKYKQGLELSYDVEDQTQSVNPSVPMSGEFFNAILSGEEGGFSFVVDESCKRSIDDYLSVKKDVNGGILKVRIKDSVTKQSYEKYGHCTDTARYVICDLLRDEYASYSLRRKRNAYKADDIVYTDKAQEGADHYAFILPYFEDRSVMLDVAFSGHLYTVCKIYYEQEVSVENIRAFLSGTDYTEIVYESDKPYFRTGRGLREDGYTVRIQGRKPLPDDRIRAVMPHVKKKLRFIDTGDYMCSSFIEDLKDYNGKDRRAAANAIACVIQHLIKRET